MQHTIRIISHMFLTLYILYSYILMLAAMTYSIELLLCTVAGLSLGYYIFYKQKHMLNANQSAANPCCDFLEDIVEQPSTFDYAECRSSAGEEEEMSSLYQRSNVGNGSEINDVQVQE